MTRLEKLLKELFTLKYQTKPALDERIKYLEQEIKDDIFGVEEMPVVKSV